MMITLDLFKKDDLSLLLNSFDTNFLQIPMKHTSKNLLKFIPKGFRPEKLTRPQLIKVYTDALYLKELSLTSFVLSEVEKNFENIGLSNYFANNEIASEIDGNMLEVTSIILENDLVLPAHLAFMLFGIECSEAQKASSLRLHDVFHSKREDAKKAGMLIGVHEGELKSSNELETERKKSIKLQKTIDTLTQKVQDDSKIIESLKKDNGVLSSSSKADQQLVERLKETITTQTRAILLLEEKEAETRAKLENGKERIISLEADLEKMKISDDLLREACQNAIEMLNTTNEKKKSALALAKKMFVNGENVPVGWQLICEESTKIIEKLCSQLIEESTDSQSLECYKELESYLLLQSTIQKLLCSLTYQQLANAVVAQENYDEYAVGNEGVENSDEC